MTDDYLVSTSEAYRNGYETAEDDLSHWDMNPYNRKTEPYSYHEWERGFDEARQKMRNQYEE